MKPKSCGNDFLFIQLAICIERKRQLNEEFQDCVASMDHSSPRTEVIMVLCYIVCCAFCYDACSFLLQHDPLS